MNFSYYDLGTLSAGKLLEARLSSPATVMLLDEVNFQRYRLNRPCEYAGGFTTEATYRLKVPKSGRWYLVFDYD